jgi:hypothetical protein
MVTDTTLLLFDHICLVFTPLHEIVFPLLQVARAKELSKSKTPMELLMRWSSAQLAGELDIA